MVREAERARAAVRIRTLEAEMDAFFEEVLQRVTARTLAHVNIEEESLTAALNPTDLKILLQLWQGEVTENVTPRMLEWYKRQIDIAKDVLPDKAKVFIGPNVRDTRAARMVTQIDNRLKGVGDTLYEHATHAMRTALEAGEGPVKAAARVRDVLGVTSGRASVIARTEAAAAVNGADYSVASQLHQAGVVTTKEWLATSDARTRETHAIADGQIVPQNEKFIVGGAMLDFPADPSGPADETIQCRCTTLLGVDEESADRAAMEHPEMVFSPVEDVENLKGDTRVSPEVGSVLNKWVQLRGSGTLNSSERTILSKAIDEFGVPAPVLHRGENVVARKSFVEGQPVKFDGPVSTSSDIGSALPYAENGEGKPVVFTFSKAAEAKALNVSARAETVAGFAEEEWITKGTFKIGLVKEHEDFIQVYLKK